jgi:hypothetical protein
MSIRNPGSPVLDWHSSIASAVADATTCLLPQDTDSITVFASSSIMALTSYRAWYQTTPDGGTTWLDMGSTPVITAATGPTAATAVQAPYVAHFDSVGAPIQAGTTSVISVGSVVTQNINQVTSSAIGAGQYTGVPLMSRTFRIYLKGVGTGGSDLRFQVYVHNQSNRA